MPNKTARPKMTPARRGVLAVLERGARLSARDIWRLLPEGAGAGFATVYRALAALCAAGLVRKIPAVNGAKGAKGAKGANSALYEKPQEGQPPQLVCSRCGKVEDINDPALLRYNAGVLKKRRLSERERLLMYADCKREECGDN